MNRWLIPIMLSLPALALAEKTPTLAPQLVVEDIFSRASAPEISSDAKKQEEVNSLVDFDQLAKAALGKEFKKASKADFEWFRDTLKEIIGRTVYPKAPEFLKDVKITYKEVATKGDSAKVNSTVQNKADLTDVDYKLTQEKGGSWKVTDVAIAGQSWVESIRDQVNQVIRKKGWKGLKDSMNRRLNELKTGKA